ncbi:hypothetical protein [Streptosporangium sp. NPDC006007]|uniref:hypothetical protein n=1 Tax=Streptosporangium sp. NPDC006007 TaxID=3154575 RepID=UPI0033BED64F
MKRIIAVAALFTVTAAGLAATGTMVQAMSKVDKVTKKTTVSESQYETLLDQCKYANTAQRRADCRATVRLHYRVGAENPNLDCREYSGVAVCGLLELGPREQRCVKESVADGLTHRRAEVECYAFS